MKPYLRAATNDDYWIIYGRQPPVQWCGIVAQGEHMLLGIGGVYWVEDRIWCAFHREPGVKALLLAQKAARMLLSSLKEAGIDEVYAMADPSITGSETWLRRLGFSPTDEMKSNIKVWRWKSASY
jgi:hypothetical protein